MAYVENISNGLVTGSKSIDSVENGKTQETKQSKSDETKDMFLKLLVTEMKYQNPLQPTDNTEYVKEMATFSQVEALNNVQDNVDEMRSANMVGKYVNIVDDEGNAVDGKVDYTTKQNGETVVCVNGSFYPISQVTGVMESAYYEATLAADTLNQMVAELPPLGQVTYLDEDKITAIANLYNAMDSYQQSFLSSDSQTAIKSYVNRLNEVLAKKAQTDQELAEQAAAQEAAEQAAQAITEEDQAQASEANAQAADTDPTETVAADTVAAQTTEVSGDTEDNTDTSEDTTEQVPTV